MNDASVSTIVPAITVDEYESSPSRKAFSLGLAPKLFLAMALLGALAIGLVGFGVYGMARINTRLDEIVNVSAEKVRIGARANQNVQSISRAEKNLVLAKTEVDKNKYAKFIETQKAELNDRLERLDALISGQGDQLLTNFRQALEQYYQINDQVIALAMQNKSIQAQDLSAGEGRTYLDRADSLMGQIVDLNDKGMAEDAAKAKENYETRRNGMITATVIGLAIAGGVVFYLVVFGVTKPLNGIKHTMLVLAGGDNSADVPYRGRGDEVGEMAAAVQTFKDNALEMQRLREEAAAKEQRDAERKKEEMGRLADSFEQTVKSVVQSVSSAAAELQASAESMASIAEETSNQATAVAAASEQASTNVATVASASEQLSSSSHEISRQVETSVSVTKAAADKAEHVSKTVNDLNESADRIGDVVELITDIADRTNLLALNATIESARAGEAGKGFAVVAGEVKNLANQTAKATEEITQQIDSMQKRTRTTSAEVGEIRGTISQVTESASTIASAVEQQGAATDEIARNVQEASSGTNEVSSNISGVQQAADEAGRASSDVVQAVRELSHQAEVLSQEVDEFVESVRQA